MITGFITTPICNFFIILMIFLYFCKFEREIIEYEEVIFINYSHCRIDIQFV